MMRSLIYDGFGLVSINQKAIQKYRKSKILNNPLKSNIFFRLIDMQDATKTNPSPPPLELRNLHKDGIWDQAANF